MNAHELGAALGYPACCVAEFADDLAAGRRPYRLRGLVSAGVRTEQAHDAAGNAVSCGPAGNQISYVPCSACRAEQTR